jgi:hypothetical protein
MQLNKLHAAIMLLSVLSNSTFSQTTAEETAAYYSNPEQLKTNVIDPILSSSPLVSADGTTFNAQASCQSENEYLRVYAQPQADGDLDVSIVNDHDLDGTFSPTQVIHDVAGVCHNGYATNCNGDFSSCDFLEWAVDSNFNVSGTPSSITQGGGVEGCYCINNSCGAGLYFVNQERIHDDIGTGISLAYQQVNPSFGITNVTNNGGITSFYGHDPDSCGVSETSEQVYFNNPSNIPSAAFALSGTSSLFASVSSAQNSGHSATTQACFEEHSYDILAPTFNDIIEITRVAGTASVNSCGANCYMLEIGLPGNNYLHGGSCTQYHHRVEFDVKKPEMISSMTLLDTHYDDDVMIQHTGSAGTQNVWFSRLWDPTNPPGSCDTGPDTITINRDISGYFTQTEVSNIDVYNVADIKGEMVIHIRVTVNPVCGSEPKVNNTCGSIPSECYLDQEEIDGVSTIVNTIGTGLVPLPSSRTFTNGACSDTFSRPYWRIDRTYKCPVAGSPYDFNDALDRAVVVNNSTTASGYNDRRIINGAPQLSTEGLSLPTLPTVSPCQMSCKTRKTVAELGIATTGLSVGSRPNDTRYEYSYKACEANTCPIEAGETVETPCGCLDRFGEAASAIQAFRLAGKDFVCTTQGVNP